MIKISQKDFESKIQDVLDGKTTRNNLLIDLRVDRITLNNRIQELVVYNPELYKAFIEKFPYKPREYTHIDFEAIIIDILKKGYKRREWKDVYDVDSRTITRKIHDIEKINPDLVLLYRKVSEYRKRQKDLPRNLQIKIDSLIEKEILVGGIYDKKREELLYQEREYNKKLLEGKGVKQASNELGKGRISKTIDTLNRIEIETQTRSLNSNKAEEINGREDDREGER